MAIKAIDISNRNLALELSHRLVHYSAKELPADLFFELWHPWSDYKRRSSFRVRRKDGSYTRLLHQTMVFDTNDDRSARRVFGVHTDIGYLKIEMPLRPKGTLSNREKEILVLIMDGMLNTEIAVRLNISKTTVDRHRKNMLGKTGCKNSGELIAKAIKDGWV